MDLNQEQVNAIIQNGQKQGFTGKQVIDSLVRQGYRPEGVNVEAIKQNMNIAPVDTTQEKNTSFLQREKESIQKRANNIQQAITGQGDYAGKSATERALSANAQAWSAVSSTVYNALPDSVRNTLDKIGEGIGGGINYIADKISNNKSLQEAMSGDPKNTEKLISGLQMASDLGLISGEILGADQVATALNKVTNVASQVPEQVSKVSEKISETLNPKLEKLKNKVSITTDEAPSAIMNKVARLTPSDANQFAKLSGGETHGEYLARTGNFGTPDEVITKEAQKFTQSVKSVDDALAKLDGVYTDGSLVDMANDLVKKAESVSTENVKSPYLKQALDLQSKLKDGGISMSEVNTLKRLYEKNVKLGYNKLINADKVEQATNLDNAVRKWQVATAKNLGLENLTELNKQTQLSKFIVDKLGKQVIGKTGLNGVSLTDYIILAGGDTTSIAGFLTKKFFSNKAIQARVAKLLSGSRKPEEIIKPKLNK